MVFCVKREYRCRFTNTDTMLFCMRVMVGVIILYDHVHPVGAFAKTSKIDVRQSTVVSHTAQKCHYFRERSSIWFIQYKRVDFSTLWGHCAHM